MSDITGKFIEDGTITDVDISASAAIGRSKLASGTASRVLVNDGSGVLSDSSVTTTELGYLTGTTSAIQTQINGKQSLSTLTTKGDLYVATASATTARQAVGIDGTFLKADSSLSNGITWASVVSTSAFRSVTTTDTATTADDVLVFSGASFTETLYTAVGNTGKQITLVHNGTSLTQVYTLNTTGGQTIGGVASGSYILVTNGESLTLVADGANWLILDHKTNTPWTTFTPTLSTGAVNGSAPTNIAKWKRVNGTDMEIIWHYLHTSAGTAGSGNYIITIPGGQIANTTVVAAGNPANAVGEFTHSNAAGGTANTSLTWNRVCLNNSTSLITYIVNLASGTYNQNMAAWGSGFYQFSSANLSFTFRAKIPITIWQP